MPDGKGECALTHVLSDIHGHYDCYLEFLQWSHLGERDAWYIVGDVLNRDSRSIPLIQDIMKRENIIYFGAWRSA